MRIPIAGKIAEVTGKMHSSFNGNRRSAVSIKSVECNLCGSDNYNLVYNQRSGSMKHSFKAGYRISDDDIRKPNRILRCNNCGLIFAEIDESVELYTDRYICMVDEGYIKEEPGRRAASRKILSRIERYKKKGRLLDIGCTTGFLLDEARKRGWKTSGVEISSWASRYAGEKYGLDVINGSLKKASFPDRSFDVIVMLDVLEHLPNPKETLLEIRRVLKDSGILYISTPDISSFMSRLLKARWWGISKFHLYYFSRLTLDKMLDASGFKVKRYNSHIRIFSLNYWTKRIRAYNKVIYSLLKLISKIGKLGDVNVKVSLYDQIEVVATKARRLDYLVSAISVKKEGPINKHMKVIAVLPAYNAEKTLRRTIDDIPKNYVDKIILVDDKSRDRTVKMAESLGVDVVKHDKNMGYGANQKTCYKKALEEGADIVVMVHPDYQYDPTVIPKLIEPIQKGEADAVFGSRMMKGGALEGGMPLWKHSANILLTAFENVVLGTYLTEYHSGFRAYSANFLKTVNFELNSNKFIFDTEIIVQGLIHHFKIEEIPIQTRYFDEASRIGFLAGVRYGVLIMLTMLKYLLHIKGIIKFKQFK